MDPYACDAAAGFALAKTQTDENTAAGEKREVVIVIMTDGIDDPPLGKGD